MLHQDAVPILTTKHVPEGHFVLRSPGGCQASCTSYGQYAAELTFEPPPKYVPPQVDRSSRSTPPMLS